MAFIEVNQVTVVSRGTSPAQKGIINTDHIFSVATGNNNVTVIRFVGGVSINVQETYQEMKKLLEG